MEENENNQEDKDIEIDADLFLQFLLAYHSDEEIKQKVIKKISMNTNLSPEKVEEALKAMLTVLMNNTRSN
ncbi:MAG: hypothetical protein HC797_09195 [Anaerolineales bacterium]|nr:hypothetical protein [Anaerolineales bacterium]